MKRLLLILAILASPYSVLAATGTISPSPFLTVFDSNGDPINQACVWTYTAGTSTAASTWSDVNLGSLNANPIIVPATGRYTAFLSPGSSYKFVYENPPCSSISHGSIILTADNIAAMPSSSANLDILGTAGEAITAGQAVYLSDGSGSKTAGQWFKADNTNTYSSTSPLVGIAPNSISSLTVGTLRLSGAVTGLAGLVVGSSYYVGTGGALTATQPGNSRLLGVADTTSELIEAADPPSAATSNTLITVTAGETLTAGQAVYISDGSGAKNAGQAYKADATTVYSSSRAIIVGIAPSGITSGASGLVQLTGRVVGLTGLTAGNTYYASATPGTLTATIPVNNRVIGLADSTTSLILPGGAPGTKLLLKSNSGTDTAAGATNVDTIALSGLTAKDTIKIYYTIGSVTQQTASVVAYNNTDGVTVCELSAGGVIAAGVAITSECTLRQRQASATTVAGFTDATVNSAAGNIAQMGTYSTWTSWTGSTTLALRHGGVTGGGTFQWSWSVYVERGQ